MEYNPWNLAVKGEKQGEYQMSTLGPVRLLGDRVRVQGDPDRDSEDAELEQIAARSQRAVARVLDRRGRRVFAVDPAVNQLDLGSDPLAYAKKRARARSRAVAAHRAACDSQPGDSYSVLRRNFTRGLNEAGQGARVRVEVHRRLDDAARPRRQRSPAAHARSTQRSSAQRSPCSRTRSSRPTASISRRHSCAR